MVGTEIGGACKNVIALACGMAAGVGLGENTAAAIITRGLAEIMRLGIALGAKPATLAGLAGVGDLVATCTRRIPAIAASGCAWDVAPHWPKPASLRRHVAEVTSCRRSCPWPPVTTSDAAHRRRLPGLSSWTVGRWAVVLLLGRSTKTG